MDQAVVQVLEYFKLVDDKNPDSDVEVVPVIADKGHELFDKPDLMLDELGPSSSDDVLLGGRWALEKSKWTALWVILHFRLMSAFRSTSCMVVKRQFLSGALTMRYSAQL